MKTSKKPARKIVVSTKTTAKQIKDINSEVRRIKRNIKRIENLFLLMVIITLVPYTAMFAYWCKEISNNSTYFSVVGMLSLSYLMLCGIIYMVAINSVIEEKKEKIAYLESAKQIIEKAELIKCADSDTVKLLDGIKFRKIVSQSKSIMED